MGAEREDPRRSAKLQFGMGRDTRTLSGGVRAGCMTQKGKGEPVKLYVLPPSPRALKVIALKNHLGLECEMHIVDLGKGDQLTPEYIAMNPNKKMPVLDDDGHVLWESNAVLFYLASKKPESGVWPSDARRQA